MANRLYSRDHAWVLADGTRARVGISDFAQRELGDVAYVELPEVGRRVERGDVACTVDSLKSSSEIYSPLTGTVAAVNTALGSEEGCRLVNDDPLGEGWLFDVELSDPRELGELISEERYAAFVKGS
jgi:glycine cleavage system H protein